MATASTPCPACGCTGNDHNKRKRHQPLDSRIQQGAARLRIPVETYRAHVEAGEKWCSACHDWHPLAAFGRSLARADGLNHICKQKNLARVVAWQAQQAERRQTS